MLDVDKVQRNDVNIERILEKNAINEMLKQTLVSIKQHQHFKYN